MSKTIPDETPSPVARLAKAVAAERMRLPAAPFVDIYNGIREKLAPSRPQVAHEKYIPGDIMDQVLKELDALSHPPPPPAPTPAEIKKVEPEVAYVDAFYTLLGKYMNLELGRTAKKDLEEMAQGHLRLEIAKAVEAIEHRLDKKIVGEINNLRGSIRQIVEDAVLTVMAAPAKPPIESPQANGHEPTPPAPEIPRLRIGVIDSRSYLFTTEVEASVPRFVKIVWENCDHKPPNTMARRDYVLLCHRTPEVWRRAVHNDASYSKETILNMENGRADDYIETINRLAEAHRLRNLP